MTGQELKARLSVILAEKGYSQTDVAKMLGISQQAFNNRFLVKDVPSGFIEKLSEALHVSIVDFYPAHNDSASHCATQDAAPADTHDRDTINQLLQQNAELIKILKSKI